MSGVKINAMRADAPNESRHVSPPVVSRLGSAGAVTIGVMGVAGAGRVAGRVGKPGAGDVVGRMESRVSESAWGAGGSGSPG